MTESHDIAPPDAPSRRVSRRRALWRLGILVAFVVAAIVVGLLVPIPGVDEIRAGAADAGWLGAAVFVVAYGAITLTPVPKNVVGIAAGVTWGFGLGSVLVYLGALIGAALAFLIGRALGRDGVERLTGTRIARVDEVLRRRGLASVIGVRLVPVLPFTMINYTAGLTAVSQRDYAIGTAFGIIPGTLTYVALGAFGFQPGPGFAIALAALGVLTLVGVVAGVRLRRKSRRADADGSAVSPNPAVSDDPLDPNDRLEPTDRLDPNDRLRSADQ